MPATQLHVSQGLGFGVYGAAGGKVPSHLIIVTMRDNGNFIRALAYSYHSTTVTRQGPPKQQRSKYVVDER